MTIKQNMIATMKILEGKKWKVYDFFEKVSFLYQGYWIDNYSDLSIDEIKELFTETAIRNRLNDPTTREQHKTSVRKLLEDYSRLLPEVRTLVGEIYSKFKNSDPSISVYVFHDKKLGGRRAVYKSGKGFFLLDLNKDKEFFFTEQGNDFLHRT